MIVGHPPTASGYIQIIPTNGPHEQIYVDHSMIRALLVLDLVAYQPEYGPNARVYRPKGLVDADGIRAWFRNG